MRLNALALRKIIREEWVRILAEADIEDVTGISCTAGSTHVMKTCNIGDDKYFLKFSDEALFGNVDPSLQILVEYLAYRIYALYSGITIPDVELVWDRNNQRVGIASSPAAGIQALGQIDPKKMAKAMSSGVYVDVLLANWDVIGTGTGNVFYDEKVGATRIDPGGSLTFRAQGGRKGQKFSASAGELQTMLKGHMGAGSVYEYADLLVAAKEFLSVGWPVISQEIDAVEAEILEELESRGMGSLAAEWKMDVREIHNKLKTRWQEVAEHARWVLKSA